MTRPEDAPYRTRLYRNGASQAVRIPKALAYAEDIEVELVREGEAVVIRPVVRTMKGFGEALACVRGITRVPLEDRSRD